MKWNLQNKLLFPVLLLMVLGIGAMTYISVLLARDAMDKILKEEIQFLTEGLANHVESWVEHVTRYVESNSFREEFKAVLRADVDAAVLATANRELQRIKQSGQFVHVAVIGSDGSLVASSSPEQIGQVNYSDRAYFKTVMQGQNAVSKVVTGQVADGQPVVVISAPIYDGNKVIGITSVTQLLSDFTDRFVTPLRIGKAGYAFMIDKDGTIIAHPDKSLILKGNVLDYPIGQQMLDQQRGIVEYDYKNRHAIAYTIRISSMDWIVGLRSNTDDIFAPLSAIRNFIMASSVGILLLLSAVLYSFARSIARPLGAINNYLKARLSQGNPVSVDIHYRGRDEIGEILSAVRTLQKSVHTTILQAKAIAAGNFSQDVKLLSADDQLGQSLSNMTTTLRGVVKQANAIAQGDYSCEVKLLSEHDQLGKALANMTVRLREMTEQNEVEDWLKSGLAELNTRISGEQDSTQLAQNIIDFLPPYLDAQVGALYLLTEVEGETVLELVASHAYIWRNQADTQFKVGQGLVGQAAREHKDFVLTEPPAGYMQIESGLGKANPRAVLVMPFLYENTLKGVIELASINEFVPLHRRFLTQIMPTVGIAVNTAESRTQMRNLLEQTQAQSAQLQTQTETLQRQKAEMQAVNSKLHAQTEELQAQTEELQSQSEELQAQQEELRQTNEELQYRTRDLEKQRQAVEEKNNELEKARSAIQTKAEELELASKYKSEFLANMSHELRTPLNSLLILAQLLTVNKDNNLNDKQIEYANTIYNSGADLLNLINDILDLSKVEAGKIEVQPETVAFNILVENLQQKFAHVADNNGIQFEIRIDNDVPSTIRTDPQRLQQIIINLLSNAFKFTEQGHVTLHIYRPSPNDKLTQSGLDVATALALSVSDSGIGIPLDKQKVIFEAFQQADGTTNRKYGGTGLGLSISRQLVRLLGGEIELSSEPGQGSVFTVYLPESFTAKTPLIATADETAAPAPPRVQHVENTLLPLLPTKATLAATPTAPMLDDDREGLQSEDKSLLIIEDDFEFAKLLMSLAREKGFKCLRAADGRNGLELAQQYKPGAVILDIGLPQVDGWTVMEHLKETSETRHIPVHFVSGSDYSRDARRMGAIGYSMKPVNMSELSEAFNKIEGVLRREVRDLVLFSRNESNRESIRTLLDGGDMQLSVVDDMNKLHIMVEGRPLDCLVLDLSQVDAEDLNSLGKICQARKICDFPVIVYGDDKLDAETETVLEGCENNCGDHLILKEVHSPERLLDEVTLFLHQVESKLSTAQQQMLRKARDREAILAGKKILIADDDVRNVFALGSTLEEKGLEVITATNGKEVIKRLETETNVALVLMDIMMPEMDGYEAMRAIRSNPKWRKLPIIALTAKAMKGDKAKCIEAGASDYMAKPVNIERLLSLLRVWLYS